MPHSRQTRQPEPRGFSRNPRNRPRRPQPRTAHINSRKRSRTLPPKPGLDHDRNIADALGAFREERGAHRGYDSTKACSSSAEQRKRFPKDQPTPMSRNSAAFRCRDRMPRPGSRWGNADCARDQTVRRAVRNRQRRGGCLSQRRPEDMDARLRFAPQAGIAGDSRRPFRDFQRFQCLGGS